MASDGSQCSLPENRWPRRVGPLAVFFRSLCLLLMLLVCRGACAETSTEPLVLQSSFEHANIGHYVLYTHNVKGLNSIEDVLKQPQGVAWAKPEADALNLGLGAGEFWLRAEIHNASSSDLQLLTVVSFLRYDDFSMYAVSDGDVKTIYDRVGRGYPFANRPVDHRYYVGYVTFPAGKTVTLYWHATVASTMSFPASLWQPEKFYAQDQTDAAVMVLSYGALLALAIYNLFVFISTRERAYLSYVVFMFAQTWLIMADAGHITQWILPHVAWPNRLAHAVAFTIAFCAFARFTVEHLLLKTAAPKMRLYLLGLAYSAGLILLFGVLTEQDKLSGVAMIVVAVLYISSLFVAWEMRRRGITSASFYLFATFMQVGGLFIAVLATLAVIPGLVFTIAYEAFGTAMMGILFSLALAERIKESQRRELAAVSAMHDANLAKLASDAQARKAEIEIRAKNQFVATLSHEIRTPLNGVMGMADLLRETRLDFQQRDYVDTIHDSGELLLNVINDVLDYAKIDAGAMTLDSEPFTPEQLTLELTRIFGYLAKAKNLDFEFTKSGDEQVYMLGDRFRLRQILSNLLSNALKFTERGVIGLHVHVQAYDYGKAQLRFEVRDSGIGMTPDQRTRLFEPFMQVDNSSSRRFGGTGLGLAICKRLLALMGGTISLTSPPGTGSTFACSLTLPLTTRPYSSAGINAGDSTAPASNYDSLRVLVAEDNPVNVMVIRGMLSTFGISPSVASDGNEAVTLASENPYDLILMDCMMPNLDGYEATRRIRSIERDTSRVSSIIVALSAHALPEFRDRAIGEGMDDYLTKPVLRGAVEGILRKYF